MRMIVLVTGGAGYIGSHAAKRLLGEGHRVVVYDDLSRGHEWAIEAMRENIPVARERLAFVRGDVCDGALVERVLREYGVEAVMHFAALAYMRESLEIPLRYWRVNAGGTLSLLEACDRAGVGRFVLSSTCATYGIPDKDRIPIREDCPQRPISPYGRSKLAAERVLLDYGARCEETGRSFACAMLRYFNVAGCDREGVLGEDHEPETHLIPLAILSAAGARGPLMIFGEDHPTPDGTCIRDYVHVEDLAAAHLRVLSALEPGGGDGPRIYNLGTGKGFSVREVLDSVSRVMDRAVPTVPGERHPGDPPELYADASKIAGELGWRPEFTELDPIVASAWRWFAGRLGVGA